MAPPARRRPPGPRRSRDVRHGPTRAATSWLVTVTDSPTGPHDTKPAHWVDASIHAVELDRHGRRLPPAATPRRRPRRRRPTVVPRRCATRTFYVVPRVNPDGAEWALADHAAVPALERAALAVGRRPPLARSARSRTSTATGGSCRCASPTRRRVDAAPRRAAAARRRPAGRTRRPDAAATGCSTRARSSTTTGSPSRRPRPPEGLDLNRNFPAGWGTGVRGSRRPPAVASRRSTRSCGPSSPGPTSAATTRSTPAAGCCCGRRRRRRLGAAARSTCGPGSSSPSAAPR